MAPPPRGYWLGHHAAGGGAAWWLQPRGGGAIQTPLRVTYEVFSMQTVRSGATMNLTSAPRRLRGARPEPACRARGESRWTF